MAQGVLGGLRVVLLQDTLAIIHGSLAPAFFALLAVLSMLTSPRGRVAAASLDPALKGLTVVTAALVYVQIVFGAFVAHAGPLDLHLAGAVLVFAFVPIVTVRMRRTTDAVAAPIATLLLVLLGVQLVLGVGLLLARFSSVPVFAGQVAAVLLPVVHRLAGSLVLAAAVILAVRASTAVTHALLAQAEPGGGTGGARVCRQ